MQFIEDDWNELIHLPVGQKVRIAAVGNAYVKYTAEVFIDSSTVKAWFRTNLRIHEMSEANINVSNVKYYGPVYNMYVINRWQPIQTVPEQLAINLTL
jgi:hypothetical protein